MPDVGQTPGATEFGMFATQANQAYSTAVANITNQRSEMLKSAGLQDIYGEDGTLTGKLGASGNQFGAYQQMMGGLSRQGESLDASAAGSGLGGGLAQQIRDTGQTDAENKTFEFGETVRQGVAGFAQKNLDASQQYNDSLTNEKLDLIRRGIDASQFNPADFLNGGTGPAPGPNDDINTNPDDTFVPPNPNGYVIGQKYGGRVYTGKGREGFGRGKHGRR